MRELVFWIGIKGSDAEGRRGLFVRNMFNMCQHVFYQANCVANEDVTEGWV